MSRQFRIGSFLLAAIVALPVLAYRLQYAVTWEGQRKVGSEVCFYRGVRGDPFALFFSSGDVRCLPADSVLDFPPGLIHLFARHEDEFVSAPRDFSVYDGPQNPEQRAGKLETPLVRAATLDVSDLLKSLDEQKRIGVWIPAAKTASSTFIPLVPGETTILVPAQTLLLPMIIDHGVPWRVGEAIDLDPKERAKPTFRSQDGTSDVILWTRVDAPSLRDAQGDIPAPTITLRVGEHTFHPVAPLYAPESDALVIFHAVPQARAILTSEGSSWKRITREIAVLSRYVTVERDPIPLIAGGSVEVRWSKGDDAQQQTAPQCSPLRSKDVPLVRASLLRCSTDSTGQKKCSTASKTSVPYDAQSSLVMEGVERGQYTLTIELLPAGERRTFPVEVVTGRQSTVNVPFSSFRFFGRVTVNDKPISARLIFFTGEAISDGSGHYTATLPLDPLKNQIQIEPCGEARTFRFIPRSGPAPNSAFDLDVRLDTLDVLVKDPSGRALADAAVRFSPVKEQLSNAYSSLYFGSDEKASGPDGRVTFDDVPDGFPISVCARHKDFFTKCSKPLDLKALAGNPTVVQFDPVGMKGRVQGHSGAGFIAVVNSAGVQTDSAQLDDDGSFRFKAPHASPEHLVYISRHRPLTVLPLPLAVPSDFVVQIPVVTAHAFTVIVPNNRNDFAFLGIWLGGLFVPVDLFNTHMEMRGRDSVIHGATPLRVPDIAETGPITVAFAVLPEGWKEFVDPFTLPQYAGVRQQPVKGDTVVLPP